ncbi:MAG TPA: hypothetical protein VIL46_12140 [Gemmataceae bacterium]
MIAALIAATTPVALGFYRAARAGQEVRQAAAEPPQVDLGRAFEEKVCLAAVSKNLKGDLSDRKREEQKCQKPECVTLKILYRLRVEVRGQRPCDTPESQKLLDGRLEAELVAAFDKDGTGRGTHAGNFKWGGAGSTVAGRMSGVTNAGTHRDPLMECERCDARGHMEGELEGVVVDGAHKGCRVTGTYVIQFDPSKGGTGSAVQGTLEANLICPCR